MGNGAFTIIFYQLVSTAFSFIERLYSTMRLLTKSGSDFSFGSIENFDITSLTTVIYSLAGIFMLFRVAVSMINMLVNPDSVTDNKAGAGKLITRIITSLIMLIAFYPNGFIFGHDGYLNKIESAIVDEDNGLITNIMSSLTHYKDDEMDYSCLNSNLLSGITETLSIENHDDLVALHFSQMTMSAFFTCKGDLACNIVNHCTLTNDSVVLGLLTVDNSIIGTVLGSFTDNSAKMDILPAMIAGIGISIWLVVLCVDIILRRLKLLSLLMMSPVAIISYADPNDKIFNEWGKMYIGTYLDLFLKLIAIDLAVYLLKMVDLLFDSVSYYHLLIKFFYIVAILVFAKVVPTMVSKIFGLDSLSGSFNDIIGMGKKALGVGAGLAAGAAVGALTGGGVIGALKGGLRGAGSGFKGNVLGGAGSIAKSNYYDNAAKKAGMSFFDRKKAVLMGNLGIQDEYAKAEKVKSRNEEFISAAESLEKEAENRVQQSISSGQYRNVQGDAGNAIRRLVEVQNIVNQVSRGEEIKRYSWDSKTHTYTDHLTGKTYDTDKITSYDQETINEMRAAEAGFKANENISYYDAESQLFGANLKAKMQVIDLTEKGDRTTLTNLGIDSDGADILEDRLDVANTYARRAEFDSAYSRDAKGKLTNDNKAEADRKSREASKTMINNEISHLYGQQNR